jgi:hypothetical protein
MGGEKSTSQFKTDKRKEKNQNQPFLFSLVAGKMRLHL